MGDVIGCWTTTEIASGLQDFIICLEMLCFAIAHLYVFNLEDFVISGSVSEEGVKVMIKFK